MIRIEPHLETIEQTAKRAISIADFANEPVSFIFNDVNVVVNKHDDPFWVMLLQQMLQSGYVERFKDFETYSYSTEETKELIKGWVKNNPSVQDMVINRALA